MQESLGASLSFAATVVSRQIGQRTYHALPPPPAPPWGCGAEPMDLSILLSQVGQSANVDDKEEIIVIAKDQGKKLERFSLE
jgi:hypothetical protein